MKDGVTLNIFFMNNLRLTDGDQMCQLLFPLLPNFMHKYSDGNNETF